MPNEFALLDGRENSAITLLASASRIAQTVTLDQSNPFHDGVQILVSVTDLQGGTPVITVYVEALDETSGKYYELVTSAGLNSVGDTPLRVEPGSVETVNKDAAKYLPITWRVRVEHADAQPITYSIGANLTGNA